MDVQFVVDGPQVIAQGVDADSQVSGDFLVKITFGQEGEDFLLSRRQFFYIRGRLFDLLKMGDDFAGDLHRHRSAAGIHLHDSLSNFDEYSSSTGYPTHDFGNITLNSGSHSIRLTVTGKNASSSAYTITSDDFTLTPQ